jgi:uncharacterized membrane protein AbrB (regulator of aidB expression)
VLLILFSTLAVSALTGWLLVRYSATRRDRCVGQFAWRSVGYGGDGAGVRRRRAAGGLMQYLRVLFVAGAAALVVRFALGGDAQAMTQQIVWFPPLTWQLPWTLLLTMVAGWLGLRMRFPSGAMLFPMLAGAVVQGRAGGCWSCLNGCWRWHMPPLAGALD